MERMDDEYELEPELAGYVPNEGMPRRRHTLVVMRVVVIVGIACLVMPGILVSVSVAASTASDACADWVAYEAPGSMGHDSHFELMGPGGMGWQCYAVAGSGTERHVASLGLIPDSPRLSPVPKPLQDS